MRTTSAALLLVLLTSWGIAAAQIGAAEPSGLMPFPVKVERGSGELGLTGPLQLQWHHCGDEPLPRSADRLQSDLQRQTGATFSGPAVPLSIRCRSAAKGAEAFQETEGYRLEIDSVGVRIDADSPTAVLRAFATLRQLVSLQRGAPTLRHVRIEDAPRFRWRGVMLDPARNFISLRTIERQIDAMERVKLNVLHLHLNDNEGFRVESRRLPLLNSVPSAGAHYTQDEIRSLVQYAAERGVMIVPEFDVPGHSRAIVAAYPHIGLTAPAPPGMAFPPDVALNPASDATYDLLDELIGEMAALFPSPYFHIGGDEVGDAVWMNSAEVKRLMDREALRSKHDVESYFARRVVALVERRSKTALGWEEISRGALPEQTVVQAWQSSNAIAAATAKGHRTIVSAGYYLDLLMATEFHYAMDPLNPSDAGFTPQEAAEARSRHPMIARMLTDALIAKPMPALSPEQESRVLGGEAPLWGELVTDEMVDHRLWPRAAALAERFWSPARINDVADMYRRLSVVSAQLTVSGLQDDAQRRRMASRLTGASEEAVHVLLQVVTPVRNMARDKRIRAALRGQRIEQPLNTLADAAPTDSLRAREHYAEVQRYLGGDKSAEAAIVAQLATWRDNDVRFRAVARGNPMLEPALPTSAHIAELASHGLAALDAISSRVPLSTSMRARAEQLLATLAEQEAASIKPLVSFLHTQPPADLIIAITPAIKALVAAAP